MGFFDSVKAMAVKAKCATGLHAGEFTKVKDEPECHLGKTCPDCEKYIEKLKHEYSDWKYTNEDDCEQARECVYCQEVETKTVHADYEESGKDSDCCVILKCQRCGSYFGVCPL